MKKMIYPTLILLLLTLALLTIPISFAQMGGEYDLTWSTINSGGTSTGGEYILTGVMGQADAGILSGGEYSLNGGFIIEVGGTPSKIYLPIVLK